MKFFKHIDNIFDGTKLTQVQYGNKNCISNMHIRNIDSETIEINGKEFKGRNCSVINGVVHIDGKPVDSDYLQNTSCGQIVNNISGNVESIELGAGDIKCNDVGGAQTGSGDISCGNVGGDVKTSSGDIKCRKN